VSVKSVSKGAGAAIDEIATDFLEVAAELKPNDPMWLAHPPTEIRDPFGPAMCKWNFCKTSMLIRTSYGLDHFESPSVALETFEIGTEEPHSKYTYGVDITIGGSMLRAEWKRSGPCPRQESRPDLRNSAQHLWLRSRKAYMHMF
jgi:hypothetical protein